jgi:hypothetical protein
MFVSIYKIVGKYNLETVASSTDSNLVESIASKQIIDLLKNTLGSEYDKIQQSLPNYIMYKNFFEIFNQDKRKCNFLNNNQKKKVKV